MDYKMHKPLGLYCDQVDGSSDHSWCEPVYTAATDCDITPWQHIWWQNFSESWFRIMLSLWNVKCLISETWFQQFVIYTVWDVINLSSIPIVYRVHSYCLLPFLLTTHSIFTSRPLSLSLFLGCWCGILLGCSLYKATCFLTRLHFPGLLLRELA